ncbi:hypothetical protein BDR05DRAFT_953909 [Suillus weaverae]|nr:hypothetical protein BDR05DRAFT_953909 [Suillus weaverae]
MDVGELFTAIKQHPILTYITYFDLVTFIRHASLLKDDILQPQPQCISVAHAPDVLSDSMTTFLATSLDMSSNAVNTLWYIVKDLIWDLPMSAEDEVVFKCHGHKLGLVGRILYSPVKTCINHDCTAWQHGTLLKKEEQCCIIIFTHKCNTNYQSNYSVKDQLQTYNGSIPQYIQCLVTNCGHLYGIAQVRHNLSGDTDLGHWQFGNTIMTEQVWDCFAILALLDDHQLWGKQLLDSRAVPLHNAKILLRTIVIISVQLNITTLSQSVLWSISLLIATSAEEDIPLRDIEEWYKHDMASGAIHFHQALTTMLTGVLDHHADGCSAKDPPSKIKATFQNQHTNNEQLVVHPCGIISSRGTMYHHEAISNVLIMIEKMFSLPHARKPQHMIHDSNCNAMHCMK